MLSTNPMWKSLALIETLPAFSDYYQHLAGVNAMDCTSFTVNAEEASHIMS